MKKIILIVILILLITNLTSCYDNHEVEDLAYVSALGIDKAEDDSLYLTLQFAIPIVYGAGEKVGGDLEDTSNITVIKATTIVEGINLINTVLSKEVNFAHTKLLVFSEEIAREDIKPYMSYFIRNKEFRPNMYLTVANGKAIDYINNVKQIMEANPSKFYEMLVGAYKTTGFASNTTLMNFYMQQQCSCVQPVAVLVGKSDKTEEKDLKDSDTDRLYGEYYASEVPILSDTKGEMMGLAVFDGNKMVGKMTGRETIYYLILTGRLVSADIAIPSEEDPEKQIIIKFSQSRKESINTNIVDGIPKIDIKIQLEGDFLDIQISEDYKDSDKLKKFEKYAQDYIENEMLNFVEKTRKEFKSDICGFGRSMKMKTITWDEWSNIKWLKRYKDSEFNLSVDFSIRRPGLIIEDVPEFSAEN